MKVSLQRVAFGLAVLFTGSFGGISGVNAQVFDLQDRLDHLECYEVRDTLAETKYTADLDNQFGVQAGCLIGTPARLFCVETEKRIVAPPQPPGGGPSGSAAGHFLCYTVRCPGEAPITTVAQDQFGTRRIVLSRETLLCAPANKLICGDGEIDPGEACDTGSDATSTCPDGSACLPDCTCPAPVCCQCSDRCVDLATGQCPEECTIVSGARCTANGSCEPACPCDANCLMDDGAEGVCRLTGTSIVSPCECAPPPDECPCGARCLDDAGNAGSCRPDATTGMCSCVVPPPDECPCGATCTNDNGEVGRCAANDPRSNDCECRVQPDCPCGTRCIDANGTVGLCRADSSSDVCRCAPPPPNDCPCGASCRDAAGAGGHCRSVDGMEPCQCVKDEPPPKCPCGATCADTTTNIVGHCRPVPGAADVCRCTPDQNECPCGTECKRGDLVGQCRPQNGSNAPCSCFVPPVSDCPCEAACTDSAGSAGHCSPVAGAPSGICRCRADEPPNDCPCGTTCELNGAAGQCRAVNGMGPCKCVIRPVDECPCEAECTDATTGVVGHCQRVPGANVCRCRPDEPPNDCPCGSECRRNGQAGQCRSLNGMDGPCECFIPPVDECPCEAQCTDATTGVVGHCQREPGANVCRCRPDEPPNDCPCGSECRRNGQAGQCRSLNGMDGPCECFIPPVDECPCEAQCTDATTGVVGHCQRVPGANVCRCRPDEPPNDCPCGSECRRNGQAGQCRPLNGMDGACDCFIPPVDECPCEAECTDATTGIAGHCRRVRGAPENVCRCAPDPPANECTCGRVCATVDGGAGRCRAKVAGAACTCEPIVEGNSPRSVRQRANRLDARSLR